MRPSGSASWLPSKSGLMEKWEYLVPLKDAAGIKKNSEGWPPSASTDWEPTTRLEAVGVSLKQGDLVAWPIVLLKRRVG